MTSWRASQEFIERLALPQDPEFKAEVELLKWFPAMFTPPESPVVHGHAARSRGGCWALRPSQVGAWYFGVDGTFINQAGIPCVGFGPGDEHLAHTPQRRGARGPPGPCLPGVRQDGGGDVRYEPRGHPTRPRPA